MPSVVLLVRIAIWLTFFLLIAEGVGAIFLIRWFFRFYTREHIKLVERIDALELRAHSSEGDSAHIYD